MLCASDACLHQRVGTYCMIMCSVTVFMELDMFGSSWTSSIITYMHHSLGVQYPIHRCGTAEGTNQHRMSRDESGRRVRLSLSTTRCSSTSFRSLNLMRRFTTLAQILQKRQESVPFTLVLAGMYGECINIGEDPDH